MSERLLRELAPRASPPSPARAEKVAARWPDVQHWSMEIRALMHSGGEEV